jgi:radical SAM superfamily enzyme YgiQ (UPF0313 family)
VGLVQINNSFSGQNYLPYSVGILQAYAQQYLQSPESYEFLLPLYRRTSVEEAVQQLEDAEVILFSAYVWNFRLSLEIARTVKLRRPQTVIVFGGPQVPDRGTERFLRHAPFIDIACHGEGEQTAVAVLERLWGRDWTGVPSVSYLRPDGQFVQNPKAPRITDISVVPSPYLAGVFDGLMRANPQEHWIVLWETNRGCPFSCTFCDWGSATQSKVYRFDSERIYREIDWFADHQIEFVFCADANFGILPRDLDIVQYAAETKRRRGYPHALSVQNTKNATERAYMVQKILADSGLNKGVTISFQSVNPETLQNIKRANISSASFQELQRRFTRDRVETYTDLILGLPGETYDSFAAGVSAVIADGQHNRIQFNNLSILPNAEMGDPAYQQTYGMEIVESKIINIHGSLAEVDEDEKVQELQELVVATRSMPREDWVRTRAFAWTAALLHFDKILQIPFVVLHALTHVSYRELIEVFSTGALEDFPTLAEVQAFFRDKARDIQHGGPEYCESKEWLNIWWPADELILIELCTAGKIEAFYAEAEQVLTRSFVERFPGAPRDIIHDAMLLNKSLLKVPFQHTDLEVEFSSNVWEFYQAAVRGEAIPLETRPSVCRIDRTSVYWSSWAEWCREVVWYGNKKGAYLYTHCSVEPQLAGHF